MLHLALRGTMGFGTDRVQFVCGAFQVPELNKSGVDSGLEWFPPGGGATLPQRAGCRRGGTAQLCCGCPRKQELHRSKPEPAAAQEERFKVESLAVAKRK